MSNAIDRKTAEAARRKVIQIDALLNTDTEDDHLVRADCLKIWNDFCAQETNRLAAKDKRANLTAVYETYRKLGWA